RRGAANSLFASGVPKARTGKNSDYLNDCERDDEPASNETCTCSGTDNQRPSQMRARNSALHLHKIISFHANTAEMNCQRETLRSVAQSSRPDGRHLRVRRSTSLARPPINLIAN